jgi:hypothetical protein
MIAKSWLALLISSLLWTNGICEQQSVRDSQKKRRIVYNDDGMKLYEAGLQSRFPVDEFLRQRLEV